MARRKQSATVDLKVRMKEPLRAAVEKSAKRRGVSMNRDAVDRLVKSFGDDVVLQGLDEIRALITSVCNTSKENDDGR